jgi:hypothetical protein
MFDEGEVGCGVGVSSGDAVQRYAEEMADDAMAAADSPPVWSMPVCISDARDGECGARQPAFPS